MLFKVKIDKIYTTSVVVDADTKEDALRELFIADTLKQVECTLSDVKLSAEES